MVDTLFAPIVRDVVWLHGPAADQPFADAVAAVTGHALPGPGRSAGNILWIAPDQWWIVADDGAGADLARRLGAAVQGPRVWLQSIGDGLVWYRLTGPVRLDLLAAGCPLDLDPAVFPVGGVARSLLGKLDVTLWRTADDTDLIAVEASFADFLARWLGEIARTL